MNSQRLGQNVCKLLNSANESELKNALARRRFQNRVPDVNVMSALLVGGNGDQIESGLLTHIKDCGERE
jgi:hypothetical protein